MSERTTSRNGHRQRPRICCDHSSIILSQPPEFIQCLLTKVRDPPEATRECVTHSTPATSAIPTAFTRSMNHGDTRFAARAFAVALLGDRSSGTYLSQYPCHGDIQFKLDVVMFLNNFDIIWSAESFWATSEHIFPSSNSIFTKSNDICEKGRCQRSGADFSSLSASDNASAPCCHTRYARDEILTPELIYQ
ncbi:hypothetical protein ACRALDRAFT_211686 [Sodiomyces alcalophilus JCM 7366]|uniref:uncharacterized protein n=1 Tax=Sodiomyces alcalophilus JCM 7366 TaxID=591952 RepID=UPI0039B571FB